MKERMSHEDIRICGACRIFITGCLQETIGLFAKLMEAQSAPFIVYGHELPSAVCGSGELMLCLDAGRDPGPGTEASHVLYGTCRLSGCRSDARTST